MLSHDPIQLIRCKAITDSDLQRASAPHPKW